MTPESLGQSIRHGRKAKGITQEQLAALLYVSRQTVSNWENARTQPDYQTLQRLADLLDMNLSALLNADDGKTPHSAPPEEAAQPEAPEAAAPPIAAAQAEAPEPPPEPEAAQDAPIVSAKVVQPPAETQSASRRKARLRLGAICALLVCMLLAVLTARAGVPSPEAFMREAQATPDQAFVTLYVKDTRVNRLSGSAYPTWHYNLYLREDHGVGFQVNTLRFVYFLDDGSTFSRECDAAAVAKACQTSHLNGYGLIVFSLGYTPGAETPAHPTGVGVMLEGRDDGGHALSFTLYIPFDPYAPAERAS